MHPQTAYDHIASAGLIVVLRGNFTPAVAVPIIETLLEAGIRAFEFTMNSAQPLEAMAAAKAAVGESAAVGMGTVLEGDAARRALDAGADFVVAPSFSRETLAVVHGADRLMVPGVMTPTEAVDAYASGAKLIKLFPIGNLGVEYFKTLRGPLDHIPFMCNGAISEQNAGEFIRAGAVACGVGAWLTGDGTWPLDTLRERAHSLTAIVAAARA
ncbi:MAG: bifunctional 4-hydroxy-2-oxoglutarate aldolase/2-dehydro-3-deoxy-phosphogluconate aldolase [Pleurocapsa minor GSE-CHR-MK-17-07R]|jgi:2-dehydro-3-deoxyphosphogluconate aldolase/(4S)-4-hydroxy-2-oxoglutarate aldolase|nr:bifunctional 4-hydroxy-2-oxoglutarate aldolase/2-dehydro-3-deoxy-phosphogluconate aldolase [Pleurocapsa minor GSE-CHR-MK 17-07R]